MHEPTSLAHFRQMLVLAAVDHRGGPGGTAAEGAPWALPHPLVASTHQSAPVLHPATAVGRPVGRTAFGAEGCPGRPRFFRLMRGHPPSQSLRQPSAPPGAIRGGVTPAAPILSRRRHRHGPSAVRPAFGGRPKSFPPENFSVIPPGRRPQLEPEAAPLRWGAPPGEERQACPRHVQALPLHIASGRPPSWGFTVQFASALRFPGANGRFRFRHRSPAPPRGNDFQRHRIFLLLHRTSGGCA